MSLCVPFRILGTTTSVSCPGSSLSLSASPASGLSMDLFSLLPGRFIAQSCGFCLQAVPSSSSFGVLQRGAVGRHKVWRAWRPCGECRKTKSDFKTRLKATFQWSQSSVPQQSPGEVNKPEADTGSGLGAAEKVALMKSTKLGNFRDENPSGRGERAGLRWLRL